MSIVRLIVKQEIVLNLIYLFPECKEKWYLYQACSVTELHITEGADYTDLFIA